MQKCRRDELIKSQLSWELKFDDLHSLFIKWRLDFTSMIPRTSRQTSRTAIMAPISPISRKRSTPLSEDGSPDEPSRKKRCIEPTLPQTPPPDAEQEPKANVSTIPLYNDTPRELLIRSVALILEHVGFSGASEEALEGLCAEVDACPYRPFSWLLYSNIKQTPLAFSPK